jgi:hypothetical protein
LHPKRSVIAKKQLQKQHVTAIAKKQLQKTCKKCDYKKPVKKH